MYSAGLLWFFVPLALHPLCVWPALSANLVPTEGLAACNVVWTTPSTNSSGSMPLGNGDLGINLWVEQDGDLLFYLSKTDAWDEQARLLKLGRIRVQLTPNPFRRGLPFRQELKLQAGEIQIDAGEAEAKMRLRIWVDAEDPVVRVEAQGQKPFDLHANLELWRTSERALVGGEEHGVDTAAPDLAPVVHPDAVVENSRHEVIWFHRNESSLWRSTLEHQGLGSLVDSSKDPLLDRTFGGLMKGQGLFGKTPTQLRSVSPERKFTLGVYALTAQVDSVADWLAELRRIVAVADRGDLEESRRAHQIWWNDFWNRSWIQVSDADESGSGARVVSQGYTLQRFINACAGRGQYPIKFNGSLFTVDPPNGFDPDFRLWGGGYWFQNTRLPYWPMLAAGDFDLMQPLFKMYRDILPLAKARTQIYFHHGGAFFPETMHFWGVYENGDFGYGWDRRFEPFGRAVNSCIRFYWSGGLELTSILLDYYALTQDARFFQDTLLPIAESVLEFYSEHYPRDDKGRLLIVPGQSLETWAQADNPLPEIAGLRFVLSQLLALAPASLSAQFRARWEGLNQRLPEVPTRVVDGQSILAPGESFSMPQNYENPELYAIFPYRLYGVGKPGLDLARHSFNHRQFKGSYGWQQDDTQLAFLGFAAQAQQAVVNRFSTKHADSRFPAFWGPNFDWVPDQDHGGNGLMALPSMLLQWDGRKILLFPAWPKNWDVNFKLHAPYRTTVEGVYRQGKLERLRVYPPERERDMIQMQPQ